MRVFEHRKFEFMVVLIQTYRRSTKTRVLKDLIGSLKVRFFGKNEKLKFLY